MAYGIRGSSLDHVANNSISLSGAAVICRGSIFEDLQGSKRRGSYQIPTDESRHLRVSLNTMRLA